jgi:hypothetical protein
MYKYKVHDNPSITRNTIMARDTVHRGCRRCLMCMTMEEWHNNNNKNNKYTMRIELAGKPSMPLNKRGKNGKTDSNGG